MRMDTSIRDQFGLYKQSAKMLQWLYAGSNASHHHRFAKRIEKCENSRKRIRYCRVRFCAVCQWRRNRQWIARFYFQLMPYLQTEYISPRFYMLTLTVKNCKPKYLKATVRMMGKAWQRLTQLSKFWVVVGWIRVLEVTCDKNFNCHPHYHCLLMINPETHIAWDDWTSLQESWATLWRQSLRADYEPDTHSMEVNTKIFAYMIKPATLPIYGKNKQVSAEEKSNARKYALALTDQLHKTRAIASGGVLKKYFKDSNLPRLRNLPGKFYDSIQDPTSSNVASIEEQYEFIEHVIERLQKERGLSREEALAIIHETR